MSKVFAYTVHYVAIDGVPKTIELVGNDPEHAKEEASYEIEEPWLSIGEAIQGEFLYED